MSNTPRTDRVIKNCNGWHHVPIEMARELERELNTANARIKRLEEAGDYIVEENDIHIGKEVWRKAKEAKP